MPSKKKKTTTRKVVNKTAYILQHPNAKAAALVIAAKAAGITISEKYVYNIRAKVKSKGGKTRAPQRLKPTSGWGEKYTRAKPGRPKGSKSKPTTTATSEATFIEQVLLLGTEKALQLVEKVMDSAKSVLA